MRFLLLHFSLLAFLTGIHVQANHTKGLNTAVLHAHHHPGMQVLQERDGSNNPLVTYTRGLDLSGSLGGAGGIGGLLARTDASGTAYYHSDLGGNITAMAKELVNQTNAHSHVLVAKYLYDPFGNLLGQWGPLAEANKYRFSSKEIHSPSGLYHYGFRYYEPNLQRWLNRDPMGELGGLNLYQFNYNNPIRYVDPDGRSPMDVVLGITDYIPSLGAGLRNMQGNATMNAMLAAKGYGSLQEFQLDNPGYGGTMTSGNMAAVGAVAGVTAGAATIYITGVTSVTPTSRAAQCVAELSVSASAARRHLRSAAPGLGDAHHIIPWAARETRSS